MTRPSPDQSPRPQSIRRSFVKRRQRPTTPTLGHATSQSSRRGQRLLGLPWFTTHRTGRGVAKLIRTNYFSRAVATTAWPAAGNWKPWSPAAVDSGGLTAVGRPTSTTPTTPMSCSAEIPSHPGTKVDGRQNYASENGRKLPSRTSLWPIVRPVTTAASTSPKFTAARANSSAPAVSANSRA
jgi:hypothetical protein